MRRTKETEDPLVFIRNFTPVVRQGYRMGVPYAGEYRELLNSDTNRYGGSGVVNTLPMTSTPGQWQACQHSITLTLPPLATVVLKGYGLDEDAHPLKPQVEEVDEAEEQHSA